MGDRKADIDQPVAPTARADDPSGRIGTVVDKYTLVRMLGRGGMGAVYEARHARLARRFALKFLLPEFAANREILRRFENEAKAAGGLEHPNLAAVTDFGRAADGAPYLVMEYLEGEDCAKLAGRLGRLPAARAATIVAQACRGLAIAHRANIVHRDLKPENLFITDAGDGGDLVKVLDFGIAKLRATDASVITGTGATFGTAFYMSPEQARGAGEVDGRTDVWSLGVVLYELLSGQKPFVGGQFLEVIHQILSAEPPPLASVRPDLPPKLVAAVEQAMKKDLSERTGSVVALGETLAALASDRGTARPSRPLEATMPTPATLPPEPAAARRIAIDEPPVRPVKAPGRTRTIVVFLTAGFGALAVLLFVVIRGRHAPAGVQAVTGEAAVATPAPARVVPPVEPPIPKPPQTPPPRLEPPATTTPAADVSNVRTRSEQRKLGPARHRAHPPPRPNLAPSESSPAPNPPSPQPKPTSGHRLEIDKDDPFGP